jgi:hypothetical protein
MIATVISGDIIASTSLSDHNRSVIEGALKDLFKDLQQSFNVYGRIIKGDYIECVVPVPMDALRVALIIKSFVKSVPIENRELKNTNRRFKFYTTYGIRLAIGYGELSRYNPKKGIIDGEAIYFSGRTINEKATYNKEKTIIKNTLFFTSNNEKLNNEFEVIFSLLDVILSKATSKQCEVLYLKLLGFNEDFISKKLEINQSTVNQHSRSVGWNAIEKAVKHFGNRLMYK